MELGAEELVGEVDRGVEHAQAVLPDAGRDGLNLDGVQVLGGLVRAVLYELLHVHVVGEAAHEDVDVAHDLQHVQAHLQRPHGQVVVHQHLRERVCSVVCVSTM